MQSENLMCGGAALYELSILALPCLLWLPSFLGLPEIKIKRKLSKQYICKMCTYEYRKHVSTIKCNSLLPAPLEFVLKIPTLTACLWYEQIINWTGQCMEPKAALYFKLSPWAKCFIAEYLHIGLEQYISGQFNTTWWWSLVHSGYIFFTCLLKYVSQETKGVIQIR